MKTIWWIVIAVVVVALAITGTVIYKNEKEKKAAEDCDGSCGTLPEDSEVVIEDPQTGEQFVISALGENQERNDGEIVMRNRAQQVIAHQGLEGVREIIVNVYDKAGALLGSKKLDPAKI